MKDKEWEKMFSDFLKEKKKMMTIEEMAKGLLLHRAVITKYLRRMVIRGEIQTKRIDNKVYWGV